MQASATTSPQPAGTLKAARRNDSRGMTLNLDRWASVHEQIRKAANEARANGERVAVAYLRISADANDLRAGVERQREDAEALAAKLGVTLLWIFEDNDETASKVRDADTDWAQFVWCLAEIRPEVTIGYKSDRLGRRFGDIEILEDARKAWGMSLWTLCEGDFFNNPAWVFLVAVSKMEVQNTSTRIRRAQASRLKDGKDTGGGARPYGYTVDRLEVVQAEARIIEECAARILAGESGVSIARSLNHRGVPTTTGTEWTTPTVKSVAARPNLNDATEYAIAQRVNVNGESPRSVRRSLNDTGAMPTRSSLWSSFMIRSILGKPRVAGLRGSADAFTKAAWPAIIDRETWTVVGARLEATSSVDGGKLSAGRPAETLLGGILRCGLCMSPMMGAQAGSGRLVYRCVGAIQDGRRVEGPHVARSRGKLDDHVTAMMLDLIDRTEVQAEAAQLQAGIDSRELETMAVENQLKELRAEFVAQRLPAREYTSLRDELTTALRVLEAGWKSAVVDLEAATMARSARARWDEWSIGKRRAVIRNRLASVVVHPSGKRGGAAREIGPNEVEIITCDRAS